MSSIIALHRPTQKQEPLAAKPTKDLARDLFTGLYAEHALLVTRTASEALHSDHYDLVDDVTQDVWLNVWQYLLDGNEVHHPAEFLTARTRRFAEAAGLGKDTDLDPMRAAA